MAYLVYGRRHRAYDSHILFGTELFPILKYFSYEIKNEPFNFSDDKFTSQACMLNMMTPDLMILFMEENTLLGH